MARLNIEERPFPGASHDVNNAELCIKNYKRAQLSCYIYINKTYLFAVWGTVTRAYQIV